MTRKPNKSVAVAGAASPPFPEPEGEGVGVAETVVRLGLGEIDGDDIGYPWSKYHR